MHSCRACREPWLRWVGRRSLPARPALGSATGTGIIYCGNAGRAPPRRAAHAGISSADVRRAHRHHVKPRPRHCRDLYLAFKKPAGHTHAVTTVPSAGALRTLRQLPAGKPDRGELVAFGDPYFNQGSASGRRTSGKPRSRSAGRVSADTERRLRTNRQNEPKFYQLKQW